MAVVVVQVEEVLVQVEAVEDRSPAAVEEDQEE